MLPTPAFLQLPTRSMLLVIALTMGLLLGSCAWLGIHPPLPYVLPAQGESLNQRFTYHVEWQDGNNTETFIAVLETHPDNVKLVALLPTGISLFSLNVTPEKHEVESSALSNDNIEPDSLLTMLQMASYPLDDFANLLPSSWRVFTHGNRNELVYRNNTALQLTFTNDDEGTVVINDPDTDHTITLTRLNQEAIP